jgi:hypothetical protein
MRGIKIPEINWQIYTSAAGGAAGKLLTLLQRAVAFMFAPDFLPD